MISPFALVWAIAAAKLRHGAAGVHGFASLPVRDTAERLFNAEAAEHTNIRKSETIVRIGILRKRKYIARLSVQGHRRQRRGGSVIRVVPVDPVVAVGADGSADPDLHAGTIGKDR